MKTEKYTHMQTLYLKLRWLAAIFLFFSNDFAVDFQLLGTSPF